MALGAGAGVVVAALVAGFAGGVFAGSIAEVSAVLEQAVTPANRERAIQVLVVLMDAQFAPLRRQVQGWCRRGIAGCRLDGLYRAKELRGHQNKDASWTSDFAC
jgi:hypothetical protein